MNRNLYPVIALCMLFCMIVTGSFALPGDSFSESPATSFISKPTNNSTDISAPVLKVTANVVDGATRYTIELSTTADFADGTIMAKTSEKDHQRTLIFSNLQYSTKYYARAKTDNAGYGKVTQFTTKAEEFPTVINPLTGADDANPVVLRIDVSPVQDATTYTVEVNTKADFTGASLIVSSSLENQTSFLIKNVKYNSTLFARAKSDVNTRFGPSVRFKTRAKILQRRLWGLTTSAGEHNNGTVFSFSVDSATFTKHVDYIEGGEYPNSYLDGSLVHAPDGGFFGNSECTRNGTCANGEVFHISPQGEYKVISQPYIHEGSVMLASNNQLYVVDDWINYFQGGIVRLPAEETVFELSHVMFRFRSKVQGRNPHAAMIELNNGFLYGMAPYGGTNNLGVIYKIKPDGTGFEVIHHFEQTSSGSHPQSHFLYGSDGFLYGTTTGGGQSNMGTLFRILPDGTGFAKLVDFNANMGAHPHGSLVEKNGRLYGLTPSGGDFNRGVLFSVKTDGSGYKKLLSFNGINGDAPLNTPTVVDNYIYAMTTWGGTSGSGVMFRIRLDGSSFEKLHDFSPEHGANPTGSLLLAEDFFPQSTNDLASDTAAKTASDTGLTVGIFPNPFVNDFTAEIKSELEEPVKVTITDLHGEIISEFKNPANGSLSLGQDFGKGIYILKVATSKGITSHRVVKK